MLNHMRKPMSILVVDDSEIDLRMTTEALHDVAEKYLIRSARDGEEALQLLKEDSHESHPDLIILDLNMPRKDGRQFLAEIKSDQALKHIPVVILTTSKSHEDVTMSYHLSVNCYVTKPLDYDDFVSAVRGIRDFWLKVAALPSRTTAH